jgi:hypothetical protein
VRVARQPGREHRRRRSGLMNSVRLTRRNLALIVILAVAAIIIGAAVCVHFFRIPKLSTLGARLRSPGTLALADPGPQDLPCASADDEPSQPIETTVCAVVQHPDRFACKRIRFRAALSTDCLENSVLVAEGCARGIVPWGSPNPEADRFFEGACMGTPINFDARRTATFVGRFRLRLRDQRTIYILEIEGVKNVKIGQAPTARGSTKPD